METWWNCLRKSWYEMKNSPEGLALNPTKSLNSEVNVRHLGSLKLRVVIFFYLKKMSFNFEFWLVELEEYSLPK